MALSTRSALGTMVLVLAIPAIVAGQDDLDRTLVRIHAEYLKARVDPDIRQLVLLDQDLRRIFPQFADDDYRGPNGQRFIEATYLRKGYEELGIAPGDYDGDVLTYSGKLLRDAHDANPRSAYRKYTLYVTVFSADHEGDIPDIKASRTYLQEVPNGPFAADVWLALAHLRDDLFKFLRGMADGHVPDYKRDCYERFLTKQPYRDQLKAAQASGIADYSQVLLLRPTDKLARASRDDLRRGTSEGWFFCAD